MADNPTLTEVLEEMFRDRIAAINVTFPAKIQAVSADGKSVDVVPQMRQPVQREDGSFTSEELPTLSQIPLATVIMGGFVMTVPATVGGFVMVVVPDFDISAWLATGTPSEPATHARDTLSGAVAWPHSAQPAGPDVSKTDMEIGHTSCLMQMDAARVAIGGTGDAAALASKVDVLEDAFESHIHSGGSGAPVGPVSPIYTANGTSSAKLKLGG